MSKLGNDLIQSLKEAVAHAKGEGPGREHSSGSVRSTHGIAEDPGRLKAAEPAKQSVRVPARKNM